MKITSFSENRYGNRNVNGHEIHLCSYSRKKSNFFKNSREDSFLNKWSKIFDFPHIYVTFFSRALLLLKRKKYQETIIDRIEKQMDQIDRMVSEIETAQLNREVYERLKQGNEALQSLNEVILFLILRFQHFD